MKKALILTWDGYQDQEVIYPYYRLLEEEFVIDITAEKLGWFYGILGTKMESNKTVSSITDDTVNEYDFLCLPGGVKALEKLRQQKNALSFIKKFVDSGKVVSSTCHGAQLLISSKVTKGRKISAYYSIEDEYELEVHASATLCDMIKDSLVVAHNGNSYGSSVLFGG